jgi:hypothetical protein
MPDPGDPMPSHKPENDPRLPRNLADTVAIYAILLVVAIVALMPLRAPEEAAEAVTFAAKAPAVARQASDASSAER